MALVAVLAYHVAPGIVPGGFLGVETFFVLSGYLLAGLLLDERARTGTVDLVAYAGRRLRRIGPALAVLVVVLLVLGPLLASGDAHRLPGDIASALGGVTNWHLIAQGSSYFDTVGRPSLFRHVWSVAVEVQFYVLCPLVVAWVAGRRRRSAAAGLAVGIAVSAAVMALLYRSGDPSRAYYGTDARVGALLAGVLLAVLLHTGRRRPRHEAPPRSVVVIGALALASLAALYLNGDDQARATYPLAFLATQATTALVIAAALTPGPVSQLLGHRRLRWLGRRAYGIYLWHWPAVVLLRPGIDVSWPPVVSAAVSVVVAVLLGAASYRWVERPVLNGWHRRPSPRSVGAGRRLPVGRVIAGMLAAGLLGLYLNIPRHDPLAETLREGEAVLAAQPDPVATTTAPPAAAPEPAPTSPPTTAVAPPPADPAAATAAGAATLATPAAEPPPPLPNPPPEQAAPAVAPQPVTAIGDSVMVSAAGALTSRLGAGSFVTAAANRQFSEAVTILRQLRDAGSLAPVVVVHLGNNGMVEPADVDALVQDVPPSSHLILVNVRVHRPWGEAVNRTLAEAATRHPSISVIDWMAASEGHRDWFGSDGTHLRFTSGPGANAYTDLIVRAVPTPPPPAPSPTSPPAPAAPTLSFSDLARIE